MKQSSLMLGAGLITAAVVTVVVVTSSGGDTKVDSTKASFKVDSTKASFKILGTWVKVDDPASKGVFTADSITEISGVLPPKTYKYNWINEQEMDITIDTAKKATTKITIDGDNLTISLDGNEAKFIREEAYTANAAITDKKEDIPLTPEVKAYKNNLLGKWANDKQILEFTKDTSKFYYVGQTVPYGMDSYKVIDENNLELTDVKNSFVWKAKMIISDNKDTLIWKYSFSTHIFIREKIN